MKKQNLTVKKGLVDDIKSLIEESKQQVSVAVNSTITTLYWQIGKRINDDLLKDNRGEYGKRVLSNLSKSLSDSYGNGWSEKHLRHCLRFAETIQDDDIFSALRRQLSWTHIKSVIYLDNELKRMFYIEMCKIEKWSTRTLQERINSMLYERTAISKKPEDTIKNELQKLSATSQITPDLVFKDPYFLDFLGLKDSYSEKDLEASIIVELQKFISEMGSDFAFIARQKRLMIDNRD